MPKILVVEDNPDFRNTLSELLTEAGYAVQPAATDGEALAAILQGPFDFALMDVRLHEGGEEDASGLSLALAFRVLNPRARVIVLSRYPAKPGPTLRAIRYLGVVDFIDKTQDWSEQVLKAIGGASSETKRSGFKTGEETWLSLSIAIGQCLVARARGRHTCSARTPKILQLNVERYARRAEIARQDPIHSRFHVDGIGRDLWRDIFGEHTEIARVYQQACDKSRLLSLSFETTRDFLRLPLEFTRSDNPLEYLVLQHPLARFLCDADPKREAISPQLLTLTDKLHFLIIASNTESFTLKLPRIDGVDTETRQLRNYLEHQNCIPVDVNLITTRHATYKRVKAELKKRCYDIIHYAGHGSYKPESPEESSLYFWEKEDKQGAIVPMKAAELKMLLGQSEARLVYLSCCYGTAAGDPTALLDDDFLGLADAVAQAGIPSVLGFRWPVSDDGARRMAQVFYQSLLEQASPEVALWCARCELSTPDRNDPTWLSPILIHQE